MGPTVSGGYGALTSASLGIRFDTYVNSGEPGLDFSQIVLNNAPNQTFDPFHQHGNLENGVWHDVVIHWDADTSTLSYSVDGLEVASKTYDVVDLLFGGESSVFFGFGAGTGGLNNVQRVKVLSVESTPPDLQISQGMGPGDLVGYLDGHDPNAGDSLSYSIVDEFGNAVTDSIFEILNGDQLRIKDGVVIDPNADPSHEIYIEVTDSSGLTYIQEFDFSVL